VPMVVLTDGHDKTPVEENTHEEDVLLEAQQDRIG